MRSRSMIGMLYSAEPNQYVSPPIGSAPPAYYGIRYQYVPGSWPLEWPPPGDVVPATLARKVLIISVSNLQGVHTHLAAPDLFAWLRTRPPIARIGYSILVYDLSGDPKALSALGETYRRMGLTAIPGDHLALELGYDRRLFARGTVARMVSAPRSQEMFTWSAVMSKQPSGPSSKSVISLSA